PPLPEDRRLALVGDADRLELAGLDAGSRQRLGHYPQALPPDLLGIVGDPAGLGVVLRDLGIRPAPDRSGVVEDQGGAPRRALVDGQHEGTGHLGGVYQGASVGSGNGTTEGAEGRRKRRGKEGKSFLCVLCVLCVYSVYLEPEAHGETEAAGRLEGVT